MCPAWSKYRSLHWESKEQEASLRSNLLLCTPVYCGGSAVTSDLDSPAHCPTAARAVTTLLPQRILRLVQQRSFERRMLPLLRIGRAVTQRRDKFYYKFSSTRVYWIWLESGSGVGTADGGILSPSEGLSLLIGLFFGTEDGGDLFLNPRVGFKRLHTIISQKLEIYLFCLVRTPIIQCEILKSLLGFV